MALILWDQLSEGTPQHHQRSVELFYQLHNLVPSSSICEDVISQQLMHRDKVSIVHTLPGKNQIKEIHAEVCFSFSKFVWRPTLNSLCCGI